MVSSFPTFQVGERGIVLKVKIGFYAYIEEGVFPNS